jgi:hypothetical protein
MAIKLAMQYDLELTNWRCGNFPNSVNPQLIIPVIINPLRFVTYIVVSQVLLNAIIST